MKKIGILGGGQLGEMLLQAGVALPVCFYVLDKAGAACENYCANFVAGDFLDYETVVEFGKDLDVVTIEFENVNVEALFELERRGVGVFPQARVVQLIQDKGSQKQFYKDKGILTADFEIGEKMDRIGYPCFQKLRKGGYDGKGVVQLRSAADEMLVGESVFEEKLEVVGEIAVLVACNLKGEMKTYDVVDMVFDDSLNLLDYLSVPSRFGGEIQERALELAKKLALELGIVGVLAVEMFVLKDGLVVVNEMAPRVHNSGHHTIEACLVSQFEQHLRAILNYSLGSTRLRCKAAVTVNLLGDRAASGEEEVRYEGLNEVLKEEGVAVHLYSKLGSKPFRKMGHLTVLENFEENPLEKLLEKAHNMKKLIKIY